MSIAKQMFSGGNTRTVKTSTPHAFGKVDFSLFFNFDNAKVMSAFDKKEFRVLSRTGAWTRGAMRRSIRKGGKKGQASPVGSPPKYWTRGFGSLKDGIFFVADLKAGGVIIGPNKLRTGTRPAGNLASSAQLIEEGGNATITSFRYNKPRKNGTQRPGTYKTRRGRWRPRPYAEPMQKPAQEKLIEFIETTPI